MKLIKLPVALFSTAATMRFSHLDNNNEDDLHTIELKDPKKAIVVRD
jgi:hypothetical protein